MALNSMGLGFAFRAADKGLGKVIDKTTAGIGGISKLIKGVGGAAGKFSLRKMFQLPSQAIATMQTIAHDTRVTTTMMEAFGVQAGKASRIATAGLNLTSGAARKARGNIANTAFSMNADVGSIAASWKALNQNQVDVTKIGFKSFKQYSKFISMTGTDAKEFAAGIGHMTHTLGMNNKEVKDLIETTVALGKKFDMGSEAVPGMLKNLKTMRETGAELFNAWGKNKTTKFLHSATLVSGALMKSGMSAESAQASSNAFLKTIMKGYHGFEKLYSGVIKDLPELTQVMSENFQGPQQAFDLLSKSPHEFVLKMSKATNSLRKLAEKQILDQLGLKNASEVSAEQRVKFEKDVAAENLTYTRRFSAQMSKLIGADMTTLIMKNSDKTMKKMGELGKNFDKVGGKKGSIEGITKQYRDGRTASERFAIAQDIVITKMKRLKGVMGDDKFLKKYNKSSKLLMKEMTNIADKGGPMAKAMTMMINVSNHGLGGMLMQLHPLGLGLTTIIQKFAPMLAMLPALAVGFKALLSPLTLVTVAIGGIYLALKYPEQAAKAFKKFSSAVKKNLPKILSTVKTIVVGVAKAVAKVMVYIWENIPWGKVMKALKWTAQKIGQGLKWALLKVLRVTEWLIQAFGNIDFGALKGVLTTGFKYAFYAIVLATIWALKQLPALFFGAVKVLYAIIFGFFDGIRDAFKEQFPQFTKYFTVMFGAIKYAFAALATFMIANWIAMKVIAIKTATTTWLWKKKLYIRSMIMWRAGQAAKAAGYAWERMKDAASYAWKIAKTTAWVAFELSILVIAGAAYAAYYVAIGVAAVAGFAAVKVAQAAMFLAQKAGLIIGAAQWVAFWAIAFLPVTAIVAAIAALGLAIYGIVKYWDKIKKFFVGLGKWIGRIFKKIGEAIVFYFTLPIKAVKAAYNKLKGWFKGIGKAISGAFSKAGNWIKSKFTGALDFVRGDLVKFGGADFIKAMEEVKKNAEKGAAGIKRPLVGALKDVKGSLKGTEGVAQSVMNNFAGFAIGASKDALDFVVANADTAKKHLTELGAQAQKILRGGSIGLAQKLVEAETAYYKLRNAKSDEDIAKRKAAQKTMNALQRQARQKLGKGYEDEKHLVMQATVHRSLSAKNKIALAKLTGDKESEIASQLRVLQNKAIKHQIAHLKRERDLENSSMADRTKYHKLTLKAQTDQRGAFAIAQAATLGDYKNFSKLLAEANVGRISKARKHMIIMRGLVMSESAKMVTAGTVVLKQVGADQNALAKKITDGLAEYHRKKMVVIAGSAKNVAEFTERAKAAQKEFISDQASLAVVAAKARADALAGDMSAAKTKVLVAERLKAQEKVLVAKYGQMGKKAGKALIDSVAKSYNVTGRESMGFLKAMTGTNRNRLIKDLGRIKKAYLLFLDGVAKGGKKLLKSSRKEFGLYQTDFNKLWQDMLKYTEDYTKKIDSVAKRFFASLMASVNVGTTQMTAAAAMMISTLTTSFSGFNLLDVLTSGGKIRDWALRIVQSLQQAFAGRNPFTTAIDLAARNSRSIIDAMAANRESRGTAKPITKMSNYQRSNEVARSRVKDDLISATHSPLWSKKVIDQNETTNRILEKGFKTLLMLQGSKSQQKAAQKELATIDLKGGGTDSGL